MPESGSQSRLAHQLAPIPAHERVGIVLSGGGSRAAYQVGALKALLPYIKSRQAKVSVIVGSSMGALNGIILGGCLRAGLDEAVGELELLWRERTYRNTFAGSPTKAFLRALSVAILKYTSPGPEATNRAIFDPTPLTKRVDEALTRHGGLTTQNRHPELDAVAVMTTVEGSQRRPLLFVSARSNFDRHYLDGVSFDVSYVESLSAKHGLASAALPSVLPPVELDIEHGKVRLVDGGICENIPVDPAVRLGATNVILLDISGRTWWHDRFGHAHDTRPSWEIPAASDTFCVRPAVTTVMRNQSGLGQLLKDVVSLSRRDFIEALGPTWPVFSILRRRMGEELAYEVMSYVALHPEYISALIEQGYQETKACISAHIGGAETETADSKILKIASGK